ncbi:MAG: hypothetical protein M3Q23_13155 [Actinomycetota bacterium]|nr:hypothetical protein [Actinomycetota bacterium]
MKPAADLPLLPPSWPPCNYLSDLEWLLANPDLTTCPDSFCVTCRLQKSVQTAAAVAMAGPERLPLIALPDPVEDWSDLKGVSEFLRAGLQDIDEILSAQYAAPCLLVARIELNQHNQPHVHLLSRRARLRAKRFREACAEAGLKGIATIQQVQESPRGAAFYALKIALAPYVLSYTAAEIITEFDERLNPGILAHQVPEFWRDDKGESLGTLDAARKATEPLVQDVLRWASKYPFIEKMPPLVLETLGFP